MSNYYFVIGFALLILSIFLMSSTSSRSYSNDMRGCKVHSQGWKTTVRMVNDSTATLDSALMFTNWKCYDGVYSTLWVTTDSTGYPVSTTR